MRPKPLIPQGTVLAETLIPKARISKMVAAAFYTERKIEQEKKISQTLIIAATTLFKKSKIYCSWIIFQTSIKR